MKKENLVDLLRKTLKTDASLDFLLKLEAEEIETLIAFVRDRIDQEKGGAHFSRVI